MAVDRHNPGVDKGCPVRMWSGDPCGRPLLDARYPEDEDLVCLMHTHDPDKDPAAFQEEFERTLNQAGTGIADFTRFVFPSGSCGVRRFEPWCLFLWVRFRDNADFRWTTFSQNAAFLGATFEHRADFSEATFKQEADFLGATFSQAARFEETAFKKTAQFSSASFLGPAEFLRTTFRRDPRGQDNEPGPMFTGAKFREPDAVKFYKTYLGQALFHNCDLSKFEFSAVSWRARGGKSRQMVFDEIVSLKFAPELEPWEGSADERNYELVQNIYRRLKRNYENVPDYATAGHFHYGEMEMRRLSSLRRSRVLRWLHRRLGLTAWYRYASEYGESYVRPAVWMAIVLAVFSLLYPLAGLHYQVSRYQSAPVVRTASPPQGIESAELTYWNPSTPELGFPKVKWVTNAPRVRLVGNSLMTTLSVAAFQRDPVYEPSYPWGRLAALVEVPLTSMLIALVLLAIRRAFRR